MKADKTRNFLRYYFPFTDDFGKNNKIQNIEKERVLIEVTELEHLAEIGKAVKYLLECRYPMALATREQIDCTEGGVYITDVDSLVDLYKGLSNGESEGSDDKD